MSNTDYSFINGGRYQRIVRDGEVIQPGVIDTFEKYKQLVPEQGIDVAGKTVLDVGCNTGEMCRYAAEGGAYYVLGIDKNPEYIASARQLHPDLRFNVQTLAGASGIHWDVVIASAMLHYVPNLSDALRDLARLSDCVVGDIVVCDHYDESIPAMTLSDRGLLTPNWRMFKALANRHFATVHCGPRALSPDNSHRRLFRLGGRRPLEMKATLIWGPGGAGKTTLARDLVAGEGYHHLQTDSIFLDWRQEVEPGGSLSNMDFVDGIHRVYGAAGPVARREKYFDFHMRKIRQWLNGRLGLPVVIEGYDLTNGYYLDRVRSLLATLGYTDPQLVALPARAK